MVVLQRKKGYVVDGKEDDIWWSRGATMVTMVLVVKGGGVVSGSMCKERR
jgi:hypothetical protein